MSNPIIRYTSRTYQTILADINSVPSLVDKPDWFKKIVAGVGDMLAMYINAQANNSYLRTAFTRKAFIDMLALIDYRLADTTTSSGVLTFYIDRTQTFPLMFLRKELTAQTKGTLQSSSLTFTADADVSVAGAYSVYATSDYTLDTLNGTSVVTGDLFRISSSDTLPSPLQIDTDYYCIPISPTAFKVAATVSDAYNGVPIALTDNGVGVHTVSFWSFQTDVHQRSYISDYVIAGQGDGSIWQEVVLPDLKILSDTVALRVNGDLGWTKVLSFVDSVSTSKHFMTEFDSYGNCRLKFGNGVYGALPTGDIEVYYAVGGGSLSNINALNSIVNYTGGNPAINGVNNYTIMNGGSDFESVENAKVIAPQALKARDRFITKDDGKALSLGFGGVIRAYVIPNKYGVLTCAVVIVPSGGGVPSSTLKGSLQTYIISRTVLEAIDVRVEDPNYLTQNVVGTGSVQSGYTWAGVSPYMILAIRLFFSERSFEIVSVYQQEGIGTAVLLINTIWSTSFGPADYNQVQALLIGVTPVDFESTLELSRLDTYVIGNVVGANSLNISAPSFPIVLTGNDISTIGTVTLTEV